MPRQVLAPPTGITQLPDVPNWSWHEYGMRVGFWRFHALLRAARDPAQPFDQRRVCIDYPRVAQACKGRRVGVHGPQFRGKVPFTTKKTQPAMIERTVATIKEFTGKPPSGWMGPGLTETYDTPTISRQRGSSNLRLGV